MTLLETIRGPRDLDALTKEQLEQLAAEIREHLVLNVAKTGGHLGPNLGVVELTLAIHSVFDSPVTRSSSTPATSPTCTRSSLGGRTSPPCARPTGWRATRSARSRSTTSSRARTPRVPC